MIPAPGPDCARFAPLLPLLEGGELEAEQAEVARSHIATCAWCQRQLASYATVEAAIRRTFDLSGPSGSITTMEEIMRRIEPGHMESSATTTTSPSAPPFRPLRQVRVLAGAAAIAAVLLIAVLAATLFGSHRGRPGVTGVLVTLPPALATKTVYVATYQGVAAVRASDGARRWESNAPPPAPANCPRSLAFADGVLYVGCDPNVTALRTSDGAELWSTSVAVRAVPYAGPNLVANDGILYVTPYLPSIDPFGKHVPDSHIPNSEVYRTIYALSAGDGHELWHYQADEPILTAPTIASGLVFFSTTANVYALRADTGALLWRSALVGSAAPQGEVQRIAASAAITADGDLIYVSAIIVPRPGAASNTNAASDLFDLLTLRAADGEHLIRQENTFQPNQVVWSGLQAVRPAVANGAVYTQDVNGIIAYSADPAVHSIVRIYFIDIYGYSGAVNGPALAGDMLFGSGFGYVFAFNLGSSDPVWRVTPEGGEIIRNSRGIEPYGPPTAVGGAVFVVHGNALYALRASDGATAWSHMTRPATTDPGGVSNPYSDAPLVG